MENPYQLWQTARDEYKRIAANPESHQNPVLIKRMAALTATMKELEERMIWSTPVLRAKLAYLSSI